MSALDDAVQTHMAHAAMSCDDLLTESLCAQCTQPTAQREDAEGEHRAQLAADEALMLPRGWGWGGAAVLVITWACSAIWPWGFAK